jgi:D-alanyl-D-alanine carboxypeptidase
MADAASVALASEWLPIVALGILCGAAGQVIRAIAGLKKLGEDAKEIGTTLDELFSGQKLMISILIGATAGLLAAVTTVDSREAISRVVMVGLVAAGYAGADFIEAFARDYLPSNKAAQVDRAAGHAARIQHAARLGRVRCIMFAGFTSHSGSVTTVARLNVRRLSPIRIAPAALTAEPGTVLQVIGIGPGETVAGNSTWYAGADDTYFWSGGCSDFRTANAPMAALSGAAPISVNKRPDGTIRPLAEPELRRIYGDIQYQDTEGGRIRILGDWTAKNIVDVTIPVLAAMGFDTVQLHRTAQPSFERAFAAVEAAGLSSRILTWGGSFVPRHKGWKISRGLSSHSWGVAIDMNVAWNGYGHDPAPIGTHGTLRELVPFFEAEGFAWGGYFTPPDQDGMHFELARLDL